MGGQGVGGGARRQKCDPGLIAALKENIPRSLMFPITTATVWASQEGQSSISRDCNPEEREEWLNNIPLYCNSEDNLELRSALGADIRPGAEVDLPANGCIEATHYDYEFGGHDQSGIRELNGTYTVYHNISDDNEMIAFVKQELNQPSEVYLSELSMIAPKKISNFNSNLCFLNSSKSP